MRGHVEALALLLGNVVVDGVEKTFEGDKPHMAGGSGERGWDLMEDGGASPELVAFFRGAFDVQTAARSIALTIESVAADLRRRVPAALMRRVHETVVDLAPPPVAPSPASAVSPSGDGSSPHVAALQAGDEKRGRKRARPAAKLASRSGSSSPTEQSTGSDVSASEEDDGLDLPRPVPKPSKVVWERDAPLLAYGEALEEPALASTGGTMGAALLFNLSFPLLPHIPSTAASALKVMEFVRVVVVDPALVWAPQGSWVAVDELVSVLRSERFSVPSLPAVLQILAVVAYLLNIRILGPVAPLTGQYSRGGLN